MRRAVHALAVLLLGLVTIAPAVAHTELTGIDLYVESSRQAVRLTFSEDVSTLGTRVMVLDPHGHAVQAGDPGVHGNVVETPLLPLSLPGEYRVNFRVVADDGHAITGSEHFTVAEGTMLATVTPTLTPSPETSAVLADSATVGFWITGFLMLCGALGGAAVWRLRRTRLD